MEKQPATNMLHNRIIDEINACPSLSKEDTAKALKEIAERVASKRLNLLPDKYTLSLNSLFVFNSSEHGFAFWKAIAKALDVETFKKDEERHLKNQKN